MDTIYKINGYDWFSDLNVLMDNDRTTADSFEKPAGVFEAEKYQWGDGILEVDLLSPVLVKPRLFVIKGTMVFDTLLDYEAGKAKLNGFIRQNYVTLEAIHLGVKANARIQPDGIEWERLTALDAPHVLVSVTFKFDEIQQAMPFKNEGSEGLFYYFGSAISVPTDSVSVKALPERVLGVVGSLDIVLNTGVVNRVFSVVLPVGKTIISAFDATSEEDIRSNFAQSNIQVDAVAYRIFTMQNALSYSTNHVFQISINNG